MSQRLKSMLLALALLAAAAPLARADWNGSRADAHAPIGVMAEHVHHRGEWMASYRLMGMGMQGNMDGSTRLSPAEVRAQGFMMVPTRMTTLMHMLGLMHAPTDWLTLMVMLPVQQKWMHTEAGMPLGATRFSTHSAGLGDISITGMFKILEGEHYRLQLNAGLGLPSGSIGVYDDTPAASHTLLPYPMRLGTGSLSFLPGATFLLQGERFSGGAQATASVPLYENQALYRASSTFRATVWGAVLIRSWISASLRLASTWRSDIHGADPGLNPAMAPTADPGLRGGFELDAFAGVNLFASEGALHGHRLALEGGLPLFRSLHGPQLASSWMATLGWQYSF